MSHNNPLTTIRHKRVLANMIFDVMRNENVSMLQAHITVASMASDGDVLEIVRKKVDEYNGVEE